MEDAVSYRKEVICVQILICEDERRLASALQHILEEEKYRTDVVYTGTDALDYGKSGIYDVIVMDVMMPGMDGMEAVRLLRRAGVETPVLMLTARSTLADKVAGLDSGADDYLTKPFAAEELLARIRALTRRRGEVILDEMRTGDTTFCISSSLLCVGEKQIQLNYKEAEILKLLMSRPACILPKEEIITRVWGYDSDAGDGNVEAYISFLRKKLHFVGSGLSIVAVKKQGYKLEVGVC